MGEASAPVLPEYGPFESMVWTHSYLINTPHRVDFPKVTRILRPHGDSSCELLSECDASFENEGMERNIGANGVRYAINTGL
jgi:hypothetical protein